MIWTAKLYDKSNAFVCELPFDSLTITQKLNDIHVASISVDYSILKDRLTRQGTNVTNALTAGFRWVDIVRGTTTIFRGILNEPTITKNSANVVVTLPFKSWLAYFSKRFTSAVYTSTDAGAIAWGLINTAQGVTDGSIGITSGTITATKTRDRTFVNDDIAKVIIAMSSNNIASGYDFEITNEKVLTVLPRLGSDKPAIVFDFANTIAYKLAVHVGLGIVTKSIQLGAGLGAQQLNQSAVSSGTYTGKWYLQEKITSNTSVSETTTLLDYADKEIAKNQDYNITCEITVETSTVDPTTYGVGDAITVKIEDIINSLLKIKTKTYTVSSGNEIVKLDFI